MSAAGVAAAAGFGFVGLAVLSSRRLDRVGAGRGLLWRNRLASASFVAATVAGIRAVTSDPAAREEIGYTFVVTLGYGHLLGAAWLGRRRVRARLPRGAPWVLLSLCGGIGLALLFFGYRAGLELAVRDGRPELLGPVAVALLAAAFWHTIENDVEMGRSYAQQLGHPVPGQLATRFRLRPLSRSPLRHICLLGVALAYLACIAWIVAIAGIAAGRSTAAELVFAPILYHLVSWLLLFADRARLGSGPAATLWTTAAAVHAGPALLCIALLVWPSPRADFVRLLVFSPGIYVFWSFLHVVQTAASRELAAGSGREPGPALGPNPGRAPA